MLTTIQHATIQFKVLNTTDTTANHADNVKPLNVYIAKRYFTEKQEGSITDLITSMHTAYNPKTKAFTFFTDKDVADWALGNLDTPFTTVIPGTNRSSDASPCTETRRVAPRSSQAGLPPPLLTVHAQQARLLPKHKSEKGHARHADV